MWYARQKYIKESFMNKKFERSDAAVLMELKYSYVQLLFNSVFEIVAFLTN